MGEQYLAHSRNILGDKNSYYKPNRTGVDSISRFGHQNEYDLSEGFPLLTTKKMPFKSIAHELIWFLRGDTNIKYLVDNNVRIWDGNAFQHFLKKQGKEKDFPMYSSEWKESLKDYISRIKEDVDFAGENGNLGDVYGAQWRKWEGSNGKRIDQIADTIEILKKNPNSRRMIVSAWNPEQVPSMALPPCHTLFHLNTREGKLDLQLYQRSCDMFLGVPFNIASYAMLTQILAQESGLEPGNFVHSFGDAHFYCGTKERGEWYGKNLDDLKSKIKIAASGGWPLDYYLEIKSWIEENSPPEREEVMGQDHVTAILEQLSREPLSKPRMSIARKPFDKLTIDDFVLSDYKSHPAIKREMAV